MVDVLFPGRQGYSKTKALPWCFHLRMEGSLTDRPGPWWTMSGRPDPGEEAFLLGCPSPGRPGAQAENVLHVGTEVVWHKREEGNAVCQPPPSLASLCPWWLER